LQRWVLANAIGFPLGGAVGGGVGRAIQMPYVGTTSPLHGAQVLAGAAALNLGALGAVVGIAQWLALRGRLARAAWWAPVTAAGWAVGGAVAGALSGAIGGAVTDVGGDFGTRGFAVAAVIGAAAVALFPGLFQAALIGRDLRWWAEACVVAMVTACAVGFPVMLFVGNVLGLGLPSAGAWAIGGVAMGLTYGLVTAIIVKARWRRSASQLTGSAEEAARFR
jgi:hypothetical protein